MAQRTGAKTFDLVELGPSAGLNLVWDRYAYRYEAGEWGREDAVLSFEGEERRPVPGGVARASSLACAVESGSTVRRSTSPSEDGARLLRSFVWAGQDDRMRRLDQAIEARSRRSA